MTTEYAKKNSKMVTSSEEVFVEIEAEAAAAGAGAGSEADKLL